MAIDSADKRFSILGLCGYTVRPVPDGTIGTADRLQWLGLYRGIAAAVPDVILYTGKGEIFLFVSANHGSLLNFFLEVSMKKIFDTAYARLKDITAADTVSGSEISTSSTSLTRVRTASSITLVDGREYQMEYGGSVNFDGGGRGAVLIGDV